MCTNDLIVLHSLGIFSFSFSFLVRKIPFAGNELTSQRVRGLRGTSELPGRPYTRQNNTGKINQEDNVSYRKSSIEERLLLPRLLYSRMGIRGAMVTTGSKSWIIFKENLNASKPSN